MLDGEPAAAITRLLACHIEAALLALGADRDLLPSVPVSLVSAQLASGKIALLRAWLTGRASAQPETIAKLIHGTTYAAAIAALAPKLVP
ncbi:hypothetical protein GCM10011529_30980 [Polymorphobacter glacialis]|uniref:Uncharacterized protein n=1 Tax=Sandarakinorhabdus glacialis TaxID=1614636 RepID=A0A917ECG2_9SPHN|nr:hypothetical protein [Polymorphobacter glacialis]GGE22183.1 hypothetical protein GCM10011529_30980 [Polymorphobacter glacialis]